MAHPFEGQVKASNARRLKALGATAGKSFGASKMFHAKSYPSKNAGSSTPMTISGGTSKKRADRKSNKYADGGRVFGSSGGFGARPSGGGGKKKGKSKGSTTNIVIAGGGPGGGQDRPVPVPVPRPVPVPVAGGAPPVARPVGAPPVGGPGLGGMGGGAPVNVNVPPPAAAMPAMRPPGMKFGGAVKKKSGFLKDQSPSGYRGFPRSPTTEVDEAVSGKKHGGAVKKRQMGGGLGGPGVRPRSMAPIPGATGAPVAPGAPGAPARVPLTGGNPGLTGGRGPVGGGRPFGMKKGGSAKHDDEAQDKKLIRKMMKQEDKAESKKYADGGDIEDDMDVTSGGPSAKSVLGGAGKIAGMFSPPKTSQSGAQGATGAANTAAGVAAQAGKDLGVGIQSAMKGAGQSRGYQGGALPGAMGGSKFQIAKDGGFIPKNATSKDSALSASKYRQQGVGYNKGGAVKRAGGASGLGRLQRIPAARSVPAKTEI